MWHYQRASSGTVCHPRAGSSCNSLWRHCSRTADLIWRIKPRSCADASRVNPEHTHRSITEKCGFYFLHYQKQNASKLVQTTWLQCWALWFFCQWFAVLISINCELSARDFFIRIFVAEVWICSMKSLSLRGCVWKLVSGGEGFCVLIGSFVMDGKIAMVELYIN